MPLPDCLKGPKYYKELGFEHKKILDQLGRTKYFATCKKCGNHLRNTSISRLKQHRNVCFSEKYNNQAPESEHMLEDREMEETQQKSSSECLKSENNESSPDVGSYEPSKLGRKKGRYYELLGFKSTRIYSSSGQLKTVATCLVCNNNVHNTSGGRLLAHRKSCTSDKYNAELPNEEILILRTDSNEASMNDDFSGNVCSDEINQGIYFNEEAYTNNDSETKLLPAKTEEESMDFMISNISNLKEAVANFVYGCCLPLSITESVYFKQIMLLVPNCLSQVPNTIELTTCLLTNHYKKSVEENKKLWPYTESAMVVHTIECKNGQKFLVSMLQNALKGTRLFLNCVELKNSYDEDLLFNEIVTESVRLARQLYNIKVFAIVTDKIVDNQFEANYNNVWYITCQNYLASGLLNDLLGTLNFKTCFFKIRCIVDALKNVDFREILSYKMSLLTTDIDNLHFVLDNWDVLKEALCKRGDVNVSLDVCLAFFDFDFKTLCHSYCDQYTVLKNLIDKLSSPTCSLADSLVLWQNFIKNPTVKNSTVLWELSKEKIQETKKIYSLFAHYFGEGRSPDFSAQEHRMIKDFLIQVLSEQGKKQFKSFEYFEHPSVANRDDFYESSKFWESMKSELPDLAEFALKMLGIPASSRLEGDILSDFSTNNNTSKVQCMKLMAVYFDLKNKAQQLNT